MRFNCRKKHTYCCVVPAVLMVYFFSSFTSDQARAANELVHINFGKMLVLVLGTLVATLLAAFLFGFFFMRSSKNLPASFSQLYAEVLWQISGFVSMVEDHVLKHKNHTGELVEYSRAPTWPRLSSYSIDKYS